MTPPPQKLACQPNTAEGEDQLRRVRRIRAALPQTTEKLSHREPTFFVRKKGDTMFANNHHGDGHVGLWIPGAPGLQERLIKSEPNKFFKPLTWACAAASGIAIDEADDHELARHISRAWRLMAPKELRE